MEIWTFDHFFSINNIQYFYIYLYLILINFKKSIYSVVCEYFSPAAQLNHKFQ